MEKLLYFDICALIILVILITSTLFQKYASWESKLLFSLPC